jgi:hypothetical protein
MKNKKYRFLNFYTNYNRFLELRKNYEDSNLSYLNTNSEEYYSLVYKWSVSALNDLIRLTGEENGKEINIKYEIEHANNVKKLKTNIKTTLREITEKFYIILSDTLENKINDEIQSFKKSINDKYKQENKTKEKVFEEILNEYYNCLSKIKTSEFNLDFKLKYIKHLNYTFQQETR